MAVVITLGQMNSMRSVACLIVFALLLIGCSGQQLDPRIETSGVYRGVTADVDKDGNKSWTYLRFYDDSVVISTSSSNRPSELKSWFSRDHKLARRGLAFVKGNQITFTTTGIEGSVDSKGSITGNRLDLIQNSKILGYEGEYKLSVVFVGWSDDIGQLRDD